MISSATFSSRFLARRALSLGLCAALALTSAAAHAQDATSTSSVAPDQANSGATETVSVNRGAVTVRPGGEIYSTANLRVAIVGATETSGDVDLARRGLAAAYAAIASLPGYQNVSPAAVSAAMRTTTPKRDAIRQPDYIVLNKNKSVRADRTLAVTLRPGDATGTSATYTAIVELIDAASGGLAGRGEATFTATEGQADIATTPLTQNGATSVTPAANLARDVRVGQAASVRESAVDGAVARAVFDLNRPISVRGVVLSKMARTDTKGAPYYARISLGEMTGVRVGTPIEYLSPQGDSLGFGTIVDMAAGESLATVAPENAYANLYINCEVRNLDNPPLARAGRSAYANDEREWKRFEKSFGIALAVAGAAYLAFK
jgi:hypothetical protein